ncbi:hypothetical protein BK819_11850 [Microbacterium sp. LCT-H2]|nr:hypothetical protein BK819_11850 [Microbacterium sp. LCT-H2]
MAAAVCRSRADDEPAAGERGQDALQGALGRFQPRLTAQRQRQPVMPPRVGRSAVLDGHGHVEEHDPLQRGYGR